MAKSKTYADIARKAKEDGKAVQVSYALKGDWEEGEDLIGKLEKASQVYFDEQDDPVNQYIFDTDGGRISVLLGRGVDKQISHVVRVGDVLGLTYKGQRKTNKGYNVNEFDVVILESGNGKTISETLAESTEEPKHLDRDLPDATNEIDA